MNVMQTLSRTMKSFQTIAAEARGLSRLAPGSAESIERAARLSTAIDDAARGVTALRHVQLSGPHTPATRSVLGSASDRARAMQSHIDVVVSRTTNGRGIQVSLGNIAVASTAAADALKAVWQLIYRP